MVAALIILIIVVIAGIGWVSKKIIANNASVVRQGSVGDAAGLNNVASMNASAMQGFKHKLGDTGGL